MAPKRKAGQSTVAKAAVAPARETRSAARVTRSSAKSSSVNFIELPDTVKIRKSSNKKQKIAEVKGKGKAKAKAKEDSASEDEKDEEEAPENVLEDSTSKPVVIIEHCKQCQSFAKRAIQVKEGLEESDCDVIVKLNPEKPRRGCFEIRQDGGKVFVSLLEMKRPFKPMKDLNMDKVISDIITDLSNSS